MRYVGRFAPSPTGPVHPGTLAAAVASFLHARRAQGEWLVRIEDIDPPREVPGAAAAILRTLEAFDLHWDRDVRYQSRHLDTYFDAASTLVAGGAAYHCRCSRRQIRALTGGTRYPGTCRDKGLPAGDTAVRLRVDRGPVTFRDALAGPIERDVPALDGDFVIVRRDGLPAYHLAVVLDDADQGVTDVIRGADLLESTAAHICLQTALDLPTPRYGHIPLLTDAAGQKLAKRSGAAAIDTARAGRTAARILALLGLKPPAVLAGARPAELWDWAVPNFRVEDLARLPGRIRIDE